MFVQSIRGTEWMRGVEVMKKAFKSKIMREIERHVQLHRYEEAHNQKFLIFFVIFIYFFF